MRLHRGITGLAVAAMVGMLGPPAKAAETAHAAAPDSPEAARQVAIATKLAGKDLTDGLFMCKAHGSDNEGLQLIIKHRNIWLPSVQLFDNLYYVGSRVIGVFILKTSSGLILFDSGTTVATAREQIAPAMKSFGLDPRDVKYVIITHGHADHFGGASYWKETAGAHLLAAEGDWHIMEKAPRTLPEIKNVPSPARDVVVKEGDTVRLGDTTVTLFVTPGHTPGTISAMIPVQDGGKVKVMSLLGGTHMAQVRKANNRVGGLENGERSMRRLIDLAARYHAVGLLNTHTYADGSMEKLDALRAGASRTPNPFVIGNPAVVRYYKMMHHCMLAQLARPEAADWVSEPYPE